MSAQRLSIAAAARADGLRPRARRTSDLPVRGPGGVSIARGADRPEMGANGTSSAGTGVSAMQRAVNGSTTAAVTAAAMVTAPMVARPAGRDASPTIRRSTATPGNGSGTGSGALSGPSPTGSESHDGHDGHHGRTRPGGAGGASGASGIPSTTEVLDRVDEMMTHLEERILEELERRGGRFTGTF